MRWVLLVLVAGCADSSLQYTDYLKGWQTSHCDRLLRCHAVPDMESCLAHAAPAEPNADLIAAIDAGKMVWHGDVAQACLDKIEALTCDVGSADYRRPLCPGITTGALHDGDLCVFAGECISNECWLESGFTCDDAGCCRGVCIGNEPAQPQPAGGVCRYNECIDSYCEDSVCHPLLAEGAACDLVDEHNDETCDYGLVCSDRKCVAMAGSGEPCSGECSNVGEYCDPRLGCVARKRIGETCLWPNECEATLFCNAELKCAPKPPTVPIALGAKCNLTKNTCASPAFCDTGPMNNLDGICALPRANGEPCTWDAACESQSCSYSGVCIAARCI